MIGLTLVTRGRRARRRHERARPGRGQRPAARRLRRRRRATGCRSAPPRATSWPACRASTAASHVRADKALVDGEEIEVTGIDPATIARFYRFAWTTGPTGRSRRLGTDGALVTKSYADGARPRGRRAAGAPDALGREADARRARHLRPAAGERAARRRQHRPGDVRRRVPEPEERVHVPRRPTAAPARRSRPRPKDSGDAKLAHRRGVREGRHEGRRRRSSRCSTCCSAFSVVVSLFGMVNTLVLSVFERTRELGMLRAIGMTRRQARRMIRHESVITALIGAALGLALGVFLAALATQALSEYDVGLSLPVADARRLHARRRPRRASPRRSCRRGGPRGSTCSTRCTTSRRRR